MNAITKLSGRETVTLSGIDPGAPSANDQKTTTAAIASLVAPTAPAVRTSQLLKALAASQVNGVKALIAFVSGDPDDFTNVSLNRSAYATPTGPLATAIQSAFGFSAATMAILFALAATEVD